MTIKNTNRADANRPDAKTEHSPDSKPETRPRGHRYGDLLGQWPGDINDGFEEWVREERNKHFLREPPPWW